MNRYEVLFVIQPDASEETISEATEKAQDQVTRNGGIILGLENWGRKKLAYEIKRFTEGVYVKMDFEAPGDVVDKLARHFALSEAVIRYQTVKPAEKRSTTG
ncbi:MAG: 30S ribosomal protein S6 [Candidatus Hydrogenedentota bacterium]|nr:MAG: 30S ribosomal protein S6 [Candidatus Hydrogenedentota bacterium]